NSCGRAEIKALPLIEIINQGAKAMIYSEDKNKICGLCQYAVNTAGDEDSVHCSRKHRDFAVSSEACRKFRYDIFKKKVRRKRKLKTYSPADFELT
ncbi:MAG: hypothetical protein LIO59_00895, partial [Oscillospiraceae bacterium]|nr:hypothetical protein [Oscillospiraceae bacterium]